MLPTHAPIPAISSRLARPVNPSWMNVANRLDFESRPQLFDPAIWGTAEDRDSYRDHRPINLGLIAELVD